MKRSPEAIKLLDTFEQGCIKLADERRKKRNDIEKIYQSGLDKLRKEYKKGMESLRNG